MSTAIQVVAALIERDGKYLITQRRETAVLPLLWEFPGGRVETDETPRHALERELLERLTVKIEVGEELSTIVHEYDRYSVTLTIFQATLLSDELTCLRVNDVRWATSEDFEKYDFPPADQATMDQLLGISN